MTAHKIDRIISQYMEAKKEAEQAKKRADELKNIILSEIDARGADHVDGRQHSAKKSEYSITRINTAELKKDFPEIYSEYGKISVTIRLSVK